MAHDDAKPTIVLTGGGTGGHITPILAVAHELKLVLPECNTVYIGERGSKFSQLTDEHTAIDASYRINSGKYRRYFGESWFKRLLDVKTNILNLRDGFYVFIGLIQAWVLLGKVKPSVVFLKGGFVGVPVGIAAAMRGIPIVTHDSDALPGLANRLVGRWATLHATAMPPETYVYPREKTVQVGVLVEHNYTNVTPEQQAQFKQQIKIPTDSTLLLVTGGSSGATAINSAIMQIAAELLDANPKLNLVHQVGKGKLKDFAGLTHERLQLLEFLSPMHAYMGAADLVVTRASANTLAELGVQGKPAIVIPSPVLADGHQLRNAEYLKQQQAALIVTEDTLPDGLREAINQLLSTPEQGKEMSRKLQQLSPSDAAQKLAKLIADTVKES
jgi:UDP-N-acetylglucosamine--N-acetylmuramyl-(pentapeptide) pyrophosphoryl-undecaprenol N-acetylglucosamine transferase